MKITTLKIKGFMGIKSLTLTNLGKYNYITGPNGSGKSSILKAIQSMESSAKDSTVINNESDKAEILISIDNDVFKVKRNITPKQNKVTLVDEKGATILSPQTWLKENLGINQFNPIQFFQEKPDEQLRMVLSAMDLTVDQIIFDDLLLKAGGAKYDTLINIDRLDYSKSSIDVTGKFLSELFDLRTDMTRNIKKYTADMAVLRGKLPNEYDEDNISESSASEAYELFEAGTKAEAEKKFKIQELNNLKGRAKITQVKVDDLKERLKFAEAELEQISKDGKLLVQEINEMETPDINKLRSDWEEAKSLQDLKIVIDIIKNTGVAIDEVQKTHNLADRIYNNVKKNIMKEIIKMAGLPIKGLEIEDKKLLLNGVPVDKLCDQEKLELGVMISTALINKFKVVCIDGFEKLDPNNRELFEKNTKDNGIEYFITQVTGDDDLTVTSKGDLNEKQSA